MASRTPQTPLWGPQDTRRALEEMRRAKGDQWLLDNRGALANHLQELLDFI
jgi:hypothetical protein